MIKCNCHSFSSLILWIEIVVFACLYAGCIPQTQEMYVAASPTKPPPTVSPVPSLPTAVSTHPSQVTPQTIQIDREDEMSDVSAMLFSEILDTTTGSLEDPTSMRTRLVGVNFEVLRDENGPPQDTSGVGEIVVVNLFPDAEYDAILERVEKNPTGGFTWIGYLDGIENSQVTLVVNMEVMIGKIITPEDLYEIRYVNDDIHMIVQIDQSAFPAELEPVTVP